MFETDQAHRVKAQEIGQKYGFDSAEVRELAKRQREIDEANIRRLVEIIEAHEWPGRSMVGEKGALAAFLILQHAEYEYQKKYLPLVRTAVAAGELGPDNLALLEDRVLISEGKKQTYGTQLQTSEKGVLELYPIEDEKNVDKRRAQIGLPPLTEYMKHFGLEYRPK